MVVQIVHMRRHSLKSIWKPTSILALIICVFFIVPYLHAGMSHAPQNDKNDKYECWQLVKSFSFEVHIIGKAKDFIDYVWLNSTLTNRVFIHKDIDGLLRHSAVDIPVIIFYIDDVINIDPDRTITAVRHFLREKRSYQIIFLNPTSEAKKSQRAYTLVNNLFKKRNETLFLPYEITSDSKSEAKVHDALFTAKLVAYSANPCGTFISNDISLSALSVALWCFLDTPHLHRTIPAGEYYSITRLEGFSLIGYIGWLHASAGSSINYGGDMWVKVEYYYANGHPKYTWWLAYVMHSAVGDTGGIDSPPVWFKTMTYWMTDIYPGQVLWDWEPKNVQTSATITYSFSISISENISAQFSVSYSAPASSYFEIYDKGNPGAGEVITEHYVRNAKASVRYTVEPSSICLLDPDKPGGTTPVVVKHVMETEFDNDAAGPAEISFEALLYPTSVEKL